MGDPVRLFNAGALLLALVFVTAGASAQPIPGEGLAQIQAYLSDKESWTPAEQKLQSTLLYAARVMAQGSMGPGLPVSNAGVEGFIASEVAADTTVAATTIFTLSASNKAGATTKSVVVTVGPAANHPIIVSFSGASIFSE